MGCWLLPVLALAACGSGAPPYRPRDPLLRAAPLYFYPAVAGVDQAKALVFFLGNDIAFWEPHRKLARRMAGWQYDVVGLDVRVFLGRLPERARARDSAFAAGIAPLIARARHELGADSLPLILAGHSFGAELAFWIAVHAPPPRLAGILAMNPRPAGHLTVTPGDWANMIASGEGSFSVIDLLGRLPPGERVALVRSQRDHFARYDSLFLRAGGARIRKLTVPFAGHSLKDVLLAAPLVHRGLEWVTG